MSDSSAALGEAFKVMRDIDSDRVSLHYVMGLGDREHFRNYMKAAHAAGYRVTLLGYKTSGRGKAVVPHKYDWWIEEVSSLIRGDECPSLSIDTPLAAEYDGKMPVKRELYHTEEGKFSLYIDAVALTMGASSFEDWKTLVPFDTHWRTRYKSM